MAESYFALHESDSDPDAFHDASDVFDSSCEDSDSDSSIADHLLGVFPASGPTFIFSGNFNNT